MSSEPVPFVESIFHPSDFSEASDRAFAHALAIALVRQTKLSILHAGELSILHAGELTQETWSQFPAVRRTLERWGLLLPDSPRSAVFRELSVGVEKINAGGDPVKVCLGYVAEEQPDLIVLSTEGRDGVSRWLRPSVAQRVARRTRAMTLFVPAEGRGFVDLEDGEIELKRVLVPIDHETDAREAIERATRACAGLGDGPVELVLLHVGSELPKLPRPEGDAWQYRELVVEGDDVVGKILEEADRSNLVVMATDGRDGFLDVFRGSVTERVVREASCPVLAVPA
jgi:nucleotide-binding universal stress UspA family protein